MLGRRKYDSLIQWCSLWTFPPAKRINRVQSYGERYSAEQMFDVVYTVAEYPKFVPWCKQANVRKMGDSVLECEMHIGFPPLNEHYASRVTAIYPTAIRSVCTDGRLFHLLDTTWRFGPRPISFPPNSCTLLFTLDFELFGGWFLRFSIALRTYTGRHPSIISRNHPKLFRIIRKIRSGYSKSERCNF